MLGCEWCVLKGASVHWDVMCACPGRMFLFLFFSESFILPGHKNLLLIS